ncbi:restriction endonuclease subunit S [Pseudoflavonifractor phocaeensis]|uniref:restriction endonuclease subunit S n=1 Tax=Pseudoflavonifractor phocaeensis TaxID=1870988 RepID=UPI0025A3B6BD|nr:restriction endonuclease subunit S [Pseudoflavonifractor phocaeensis]MDM8238788.1 restriction endonuclease subunit S [Pseudoflavonifractor phocaeensis]
MTTEINRRIDQIRRGEVPEGYQKTKDGIFPVDWNTQKMKQWVALAERPVTLEDDKKYRLVTVRRGFGGVDLRGEYLGKDILVKNYFKVRQGDFLISKRQIAHGACGVVPESLDGAVVSNEYNVFIPNQGTNIEMFNLMMRLPHYTRLFYLMSDGVHIEKLLFKTQDWMRRQLAMPPIEEQRKIAAILTTQDKVIELKEKRLAQKQRQKKYLMQQLLTGKKRLPGFSEEWKIKPLKKLTEKQRKKNNGFQYRLILSNSAQHGIVSQDQEFDKEIANEERIDGYYIVIPGAFVYNPRISVTAPCGPINVNETGETGIMSPLYTVFTISSPQISQDFLKYYFQSSCWYKYVKGVANYGARHDRISISDGDFFDMPIPLPTKEEQNYIAKVLSAVDREIELLQQDIEQEKEKKKALMQLLLTGIVRVNA